MWRISKSLKLSFEKQWKLIFIYLFDSSPDEVLSTLNLLKNKKCNSINKMPVEILKYLAPIISFPLAIIINDCFYHGIIRRLFKNAAVSPVDKSCEKKIPTIIDQFHWFIETISFHKKKHYKNKLNSWTQKLKWSSLKLLKHFEQPKLTH